MLNKIRRLISLRRGLMVCTGIKGSCALNKTLYNLASIVKEIIRHKASFLLTESN